MDDNKIEIFDKSNHISSFSQFTGDFFEMEEVFSLDLKSIATIKFFASDEENNNYIFYLNDNSFIYIYQSNNNIKKKFEGLFNNSLCNLIFTSLRNSKFIIMLFEKGDLFIIPVNYLETDQFDTYWSKIVSNSKEHKLGTNLCTSINNPPRSEITIADLLICSRKKSEGNNSLSKHSGVQIQYKNIFSSYICQPSSEKDVRYSSILHWTWYSAFDNQTDFLIINVDYNLLLINWNDMNCV